MAASSDLDSTNPVVTRATAAPPQAKLPVAAAEAAAPVALAAPERRRRTDIVRVEVETPAPLDPPSLPSAEVAPAPLPIQQAVVDLPAAERSGWPGAPVSPAWRRPAAGLVAAAAVALCAFLIASQFQTPRKASAPRRARLETPPVASEIAVAAPAAAEAPVPAPAVASLPAPSVPPARVGSVTRRAAPAAAPVKKIRPELRQPAEDLRFRAALARIEADRLNARETAGDLFGEGRLNEEAGERFLRQRDYDAAQLAFSRAARLFQKAQELTWEERLRQSNVNGTP